MVSGLNSASVGDCVLLVFSLLVQCYCYLLVLVQNLYTENEKMMK